jgi:excisionase family DNA binding protein
MDGRNGIGDRAAPLSVAINESRWLTAEEAATYARTGVKTIYREVRAGRLRAAKVGGRRELRLTREWIDEWLLKSTLPLQQAA